MGNEICSSCAKDNIVADNQFDTNRKLARILVDSSDVSYSIKSSSQRIQKLDSNLILPTLEIEEDEEPELVLKMNDIAPFAQATENSKGKFKLKSYHDNINKKGKVEGPYLYKPTEETYLGAFNSERQKEGKGKLITLEGAVYEGQFFQDKRQGKGRQIFVDGDYYEGDWVNDVAQGQGTYEGEDGTVYKGGFRENAQHGYGIERRNDGSSYSGGWVKGLKHGKGSLKWANGCLYQGNFENDTMQGYGNLYFFTS